MTTVGDLSLREVDAFYGKTQVLFGVSFVLKVGSITTLLGANGAGKTTTLRSIFQTVRTRGEIRCGERDLTRMCTEDIVLLGLAHVPDGRGTFNVLTVDENLRLGGYTRQKREVTEDLERTYERFPRLKERRWQQAGTLSGGEQQMLAIGRALMLRPHILLLDEPSFGLAPLVIADIFELLVDVVKTERISVLLVEQHANLALEVSDFGYVLETGRVVLSGRATELSNDESVRKSYLGS